METESFPIYLKEELAKRRSRNSRYSLRAFAQTLGVSSSFLSKVMNGKKAIGEETFLKMANRLQIETDRADRFRVKLPGFKSENLSFTPVEADQFQIISDWEHYAILEATTLEGFEANPAWLSQRLGISQTKAKTALDRLDRLGLLKKGKNLTTTHLPAPTGACREHERQVLELAIRALDETPVTHRDQSSMTLAIPSSRLAEAREKIDQFRREMTSLLQRKGKRDEIYHLAVSFYPVTVPQPNIKTD